MPQTGKQVYEREIVVTSETEEAVMSENFTEVKRRKRGRSSSGELQKEEGRWCAAGK